MKVVVLNGAKKRRLDDLVFGEVFQNPDTQTSFYMVPNLREFLHKQVVPSGYIPAINIQDGSICAFPCDLMVAVAHGEFQIERLGDDE